MFDTAIWGLEHRKQSARAEEVDPERCDPECCLGVSCVCRN
jgi:hypothetical protein